MSRYEELMCNDFCLARVMTCNMPEQVEERHGSLQELLVVWLL